MTSVRTFTIALGFLTLAGLSACQDMNTFLTGEKFSRAPQGSPRVEAELTVAVDDSFAAAFASVGQAVELSDATSELVLSLADMGTRFYAVPAGDYASTDVRPRYAMQIEIEDLEFEFDSETTEEESGESTVRFFVTNVRCSANASVAKRRKHAPLLVVGRGSGAGIRRIRPGVIEAGDETYEVRRRSQDGQVVLVNRKHVLDAAENAVVDAMREVIRAVDREFAPGTDLGN